MTEGLEDLYPADAIPPALRRQGSGLADGADGADEAEVAEVAGSAGSVDDFPSPDGADGAGVAKAADGEDGDGAPNPSPRAELNSKKPYQGWADRLATELSRRRVAAGLPELQYANLAIRGRLLEDIIEEQLPAALAQKPDLISLMGGGNDILRPRADVDAMSDKLENAVAQIRAAGIDVLIGTGYKGGESMAFTRAKTGQFNANIWSMARRHGAYVLDLWGTRSLFNWNVMAPDRIHLNTPGHRILADAALVALGLPPIDPDYEDCEPPLPTPLAERIKGDAHWAREFVVPWVERRLKGQSSGDGKVAKLPLLTAWPGSDAEIVG